MGGLLGLRIGMICTTFKMLGILLLFRERLKMFVRALTACGPKCFRWRLDMPSGPVEREIFVFLMALVVCLG